MLSALLPLLLLLAWQPWFTSRGVAVEIARVEEGTPWVRGTGEIPSSAERIAEVVTDFRQYREIFAPALKEAKVLASTDSSEAGTLRSPGPDGSEAETLRSPHPWSARLHLVWPYPFPLRNRDAVVSYRMERLPEGGFLLSWKNDAKPGDPRAGVRIDRVSGEARIDPLAPDRSRVTYTYLGDLGGKFPRSAQEKAWRAEPVEYFRALRRRLKIPDPPRSVSERIAGAQQGLTRTGSYVGSRTERLAKAPV